MNGRLKQKIGTAGAGAGAARCLLAMGRGVSRGASTTVVRRGPVNGTAAGRGEPGTKDAVTAAVPTGQGAAEAIGEGLGLVRVLRGWVQGKEGEFIQSAKVGARGKLFLKKPFIEIR